MAEDSTRKLNHSAAQTMLICFASFGTSHFDVTWTTRSGHKDWFRRSIPLAELTRTLPGMLDKAISNERNVIVRPHGPGITFLQLDDLAADRLPALAPAVFLTLETSPGNFQAWLALKGREDKEFARRVRRGTGADATASGATRVAGSLNFKDKYAPDCQSAPKHDPRSACNHNPHRLLSSGRPWSPWRGPARGAQCLYERWSGAREEALWTPGVDPRATNLRFGF